MTLVLIKLAAFFVKPLVKRDIRALPLQEQLRKRLEMLGPTYIKLGQIISSGEGLFPSELVEEFKKCRDQVPAEPFLKGTFKNRWVLKQIFNFAFFFGISFIKMENFRHTIPQTNRV